MPALALQQLAALSNGCRAAGIQFGVGFTPFELHRDYSAEARGLLQRKVAQLDAIGIDLFCVLFDDMRGGEDLAQLQARVVGDITDVSSAKAFKVCPTLYSDDPILERVFGPMPRDYLSDLGALLDARIDVYWTGQKVCSASYSDAHLTEVAERLGRRPCIWDNSIANDGKVRCAHLYLDPPRNGWRVNPQLIAGISINPMNQPQLSRLPLRAFAASIAGVAQNFGALAAEVFGKELAARLAADVELFQTTGVASLKEENRHALREVYRAFEPSPPAAEIAAWLAGEFAFDPACLTD
jgi:hypothetical protein